MELVRSFVVDHSSGDFQKRHPMKKIIFAFSLALLSGAAAAEMYQCTSLGKILLSDQPCPSEMSGKVLEAPVGNAPQPQAVKNSEKDYLDKIVWERRLREIDFEISEREIAIKNGLYRMNDEIGKLQKEADEVGKNRFNALAQQSLHVQMRALASKYQAENTVLIREIAALYEEKRALESAAPAQTGQNSEKRTLDKLSQERKIREIDSEISQNGYTIKSNLDRMNVEVAEVQKQADELAANNFNALARQSLQVRIQAITAKYQAENSALSDRIALLREERRALDVD
jgi:hypothetical protein